MKRLSILFLFICALTLCLFSCDEPTGDETPEEAPPVVSPYVEPEIPEWYKVETLIDEIKDSDSCYEATKAYFALSDEDKERVLNYLKLEESMETYESDERIRVYLMKISAKNKFDFFNHELKSDLLNPSSYTVNEQNTVVFYDEERNNYYLYIKIDYSAQNRGGGYNRYNRADYFIWKNGAWFDLYLYGELSSNEYLDLLEEIYSWKFDEIDRYYFTYSVN